MPASTMSQTKIDTKNLQRFKQNFNMAQIAFYSAVPER